jgi:hypothetical protein
MKSKILGLILVVTLALGISAFAAPSVSHAGTISNVAVTVGALTWCNPGNATASCAGLGAGGGGVIFVTAWNFSTVTPFVIAPGSALVLTQTGGASGFDFDTSEGQSPGCSTCAVVLRINDLVVPFGNLVLANGNADPGTATHNEAANYVAYGALGLVGGDIVDVSTGYADNVHTDACADAPAPTNCFPGLGGGQSAAERWGTIPFTLKGAGTTAPGFPVVPGANHCVSTAPDCFDAGVVRIFERPRQIVPEPSSLLLLGAGLTGLAAWIGSRRQKKA